MTSDIVIRKTNNSDERLALISVFQEKAAWQKENNKKVWDMSQFTIEKLREKYDDPEYYIGYVGKCIFGGFLLLEHDRRYWPDHIEDKAFYVHKLVVRNIYARRGYSSILLDWILNYSSEMRKDYVRLNFDYDIEFLKNLYSSKGFFIEEDTMNSSYGFKLSKAEYIVPLP